MTHALVSATDRDTDAVEAVAAIECAIVRRAADRCDAELARSLREHIADLAAATGDSPTFGLRDLRLHEDLADVEPNTVVRLCHDLAAGGLVAQVRMRMHEDPHRAETVMASAVHAWRRLADLVEAGEGTAAASHWSTHMTRVVAYLRQQPPAPVPIRLRVDARPPGRAHREAST